MTNNATPPQQSVERSRAHAKLGWIARWWPWIGITIAFLVIAAHYLLQSITVLPAGLAYALGFKERYDQQTMDNKILRDLETDMRGMNVSITEEYQFDQPSDRTFIAKIEGGLAGISEIGDILRPDGTILSPEQMIRERVRPTPLKAVTSNDVLRMTLGGTAYLWSNGGITDVNESSGHNIPTGTTIPGSGNRIAYSDERWPFYKRTIVEGETTDVNRRNPTYPAARQITRDVTAIAKGYNFLLTLRADGKVWGSGGNEFGQLGTDSDSYRGFTKPVDGLQDVVGIAAGHAHGLALKKDGTVWQWGQANLPMGFSSYDYQHRDPSSSSNVTPATRAPEGFNPTALQVQGLPPIKKVAAARNASFALAHDGTVWVWDGLTGCIVGTTSRHPEWAKIKLGPTRGLTEMVVAPFQVVGVSTVADIAVAENHVLALMKDGTVWGWGYSSDLAIGRAETMEISRRGQGCEFPRRLRGFDNVKQIFTAPKVSAIVKQDDTVWLVGDCALCHYFRVTEQYNYIMKPKLVEGGKRVIIFEVAGIPYFGRGDYLAPQQQAEFGFYWVDDSTGRVDGIAPWESGYLRAALSPQRITKVFALPEKIYTTKNVVMDVREPRRMLAFYLITKGSLDEWRQRNPDNKLGRALTNITRDGSLTPAQPYQTDFGPEPIAFTSIPFANPGLVRAHDLSWFAKHRKNGLISHDHSMSWDMSVLDLKVGSPTGTRLDGHYYHVQGLEFLKYPELPGHAMAGTDVYDRFLQRELKGRLDAIQRK